MSPLLRRRRPTSADPAADRSPAGVETLDTGGEPPTRDPATSGATRVQEAVEGTPQVAPVPVGLAPEDAIGERPDTRRRGRLRRRLRHLRRVRELMLRDVGGLVYEIHRVRADRGAAGSPAPAHEEALVRSKLDRLVELDVERRELEETLDDRRSETVLREPGVGGTCPSCGEYFASNARFCAHCGVRVDGRATPAAPEPAAAGRDSATEVEVVR